MPGPDPARTVQTRVPWTWLAQATWCEAEGRWRGMLAACDRGLALLDLLGTLVLWTLVRERKFDSAATNTL